MTDIDIARRVAAVTMTAKTSNITLEDLARCEHSPLRTIMFLIELEDIQTFVSVHLVRHKIGVEHFVRSNRDDRTKETSTIDRNTLVSHYMFCNAQALINIARRRLCYKAAPETRSVMLAIKEASPAWVKPFLIPECEYRGGVCHEPKPCGVYKNE